MTTSLALAETPGPTKRSEDRKLTTADTTPAGRLVSLDALRGFDMFMILGVDGIAAELDTLLRPNSPSWIAAPIQFLHQQLSHKAWAGMAFEDLIFPLFVFIVGVSTVFSLSKVRAQKSGGRVFLRIVSRAALLYLLGLVVYGGFDQPIHGFAGQTMQFHAVRWLGVLQRIAICYLAAATLFCLFRPRTLIAITVLLLVGYWAAMAYVPVPAVGHGSYVEGHNLANYIDQHWLGGFKWDGDHDPEGLLSTFPAIATCLLGVLSGIVLRRSDRPYEKFAMLFIAGAVLAAIGYCWGFLPSPIQFPVIKKLWTSSFVLLAGGYSAMLLATFYLVLDIWNVRAWATPFVWVGGNSILMYIICNLGFADDLADRLVGGGRQHIEFFGDAQNLITSCASLLILLAIAGFLYRRKVFVRA